VFLPLLDIIFVDDVSGWSVVVLCACDGAFGIEAWRELFVSSL
jgi:hypothetical protein